MTMTTTTNSPVKPGAKVGVTLKLKEKSDSLDKEFERF